LYFQNTLIGVVYFVFSNYSYQSILFCIFKILFRSILHITGDVVVHVGGLAGSWDRPTTFHVNQLNLARSIRKMAKRIDRRFSAMNDALK